MKNLKGFLLFLLLSACLAFAACSSDDDNDNNGEEQKNTAQQQQEKIVAQLNSSGETSTFAEAFSQLDLSKSTASGFAIFAVTDEALQAKSKVKATATAQLSMDLLKRHVAEGVFDLTAISKLKYAKALSGDTLHFATSDGKLTVNGVVLGTPKIVGNNIIFTISSLIPVANPVEPATQKRIKKITFIDGDGDKEYMDFQYDPAGRLFLYTETLYGDDRYDHTLSYDSTNGNIIKYERYNSAHDSIDIVRGFTYTQDTITVSHLNGNIEKLIIDLSTNRLTEKYSGEEHTIFTYDADGNLVRKDVGIYYGTYSYDNQKSILSDQNLPAWFWAYYESRGFNLYTGSNNILEKENSAFPGDITTYAYEYDDEGYPIEIYEGETLIATMEYETF